MGRPKGNSVWPPRYRRHVSGQARVTIPGVGDVYLGTFGTEESWNRYHRAIAETKCKGSVGTGSTHATITLTEVCAGYLNYLLARTYSSPSAKQTSMHNAKSAILTIRNHISQCNASDLKPLLVEGFLERLVEVPYRESHTHNGSRKRTRSNINRILWYLKDMYRWAAKNDLIDGSVYYSLLSVKPIRPGQTGARETPPIEAVEDWIVEATLPYMAVTPAAMIRLQRLTGMRSGEICIMRAIDLDTSKQVWEYRPTHHKTAYLNHKKVVKIGPKAQEIVKPYLSTDLNAFLFRPGVAMSFRQESKRANARMNPRELDSKRRSFRKMHPNRPQMKFRTHYTSHALRQAVVNGADRADAAAHLQQPSIKPSIRLIPRWHPHQLRHSFATEVSHATGDSLKVAGAALGHADERSTRRYVKHDNSLSAVVDVLKQIG